MKWGFKGTKKKGATGPSKSETRRRKTKKPAAAHKERGEMDIPPTGKVPSRGGDNGDEKKERKVYPKKEGG